jgi:hypothetical protein
MGAYLDLTAMNAALKELYGGQVVENLVYADNPFLAMVKKNTDFGGRAKFKNSDRNNIFATLAA